MGRRGALATVGGGALALAVTVAWMPAGLWRSAPSRGADQDYASTALNILPSGQYGSVPPPAQATDQAKLYDGLTPLSGNVGDADLKRYFKSEQLGTSGQGPLSDEPSGSKGVRIVRDGFNVPHIYGRTHDDVTFGAGWVMAEDRGLVLEQARYAARVAAVGAPGLQALDLITSLRQFEPSAQTEREVAKQTQVLMAAGPKGRAVAHDIDTFVQGINRYYRVTNNSAKPWTRNDVYSLEALKGQFVGEGGGDEPRRSMFLDALRKRFGATRGDAVFTDLRELADPETPTSVPGKAVFQPPPASTAGNIVLDDGSLTAVDTPAPAPGQPAHASNVLLVSGSRSGNRHPLMVAGPQIGYFYPGLLLEMDLHGPGIHARGSTAAPFPGYILIGRASDYAWSLTSAGLDIVDSYVETLCGGSDTKYLYRGRCRNMEQFDAGVLKGKPEHHITFYRTVHGPVVAYATVHGRRVAVSRKRASYGRDALDLLLYRDLTLGNVHDVHEFFRAANQSPQTFNSFYVDDRDIGVFTSGRVPIRPPDVDPGLPTNGTGAHEWRGFLPFARHPQDIDPSQGQIVNWNNRTQAGNRAPDDNWSLGAEQRVRLLTQNLGRAGSQTLTTLTAAMNKAATQDVRAIELEPVLAQVLRSGPPPSAREATMLQLLDQWRARGGNRLDLDLDGRIDDSGAAIMDAAFPRLSDAWGAAVIGPQTGQLASIVTRFSVTGGQYDGWHIWMDKDLRSILGEKPKGPFLVQYCGNGDLAACRNALWAAMGAAGDELAARQGPDPAAWRADATAERITFDPGLLPFTMRYTNRPSGIQQLITFSAHRPRS